MILVGGGAGSLAAAALAQNPIMQIGLIAFGGACVRVCGVYVYVCVCVDSYVDKTG
jgi:hypothetical protein